MNLSTEEKSRYARHLSLPNFTPEHQQKLRSARVLVVGAGGLGGPILQYLAAAGVGYIGIIDADVISLSNLQRQILYKTHQVGLLKVEVAKSQLQQLNPHIEIEDFDFALTTDNALDIISGYDIVADATDNFPTRYLVNDACVLCDKPYVYAAIHQYEGQVSVFNAHIDGQRSANYRHLFPDPPRAGVIPDCATGGVLGVMAGVIGTMQAWEVMKLITGIGEPLINTLLIYDALTSSSRKITYKKSPGVEILQLENYDDFCGVGHNKSETKMNEITVQQLKQWQDEGKDFQLVDVREAHELDVVSIAGHTHIPLGEIMSRADEVAEDKDVVIMCRSGQRSAAALMALQGDGKENLHNLKGGVIAWATEIDPSLATY